MEYKFLTKDIDTENIVLPESDKINKFLLKNHSGEIIKALDFIASEGKFLYVHGFLGTGKRQFINYLSDFLNSDVIKLEYYCKAATVCDDILLSFIDKIEKKSISKAVNSPKITTLSVKLQQYISSIKKPFFIVLNSFDDISEENRQLVVDCFKAISEFENVKIIVSTRAMLQNVLGTVKVDRKIFLKAFVKNIFKEFIKYYKIAGTEDSFEDFYKYSRGYYYYTALSIKIMQAMNLSLNDFLAKYSMSGMSFDSFLGMTYLNLIPNAICNFFWFLRTIRHGISLNALAILELYDSFSIEYLKSNLMIYIEDEVLYVQDYFQQDIDISIPVKTEIRLHKYIAGIYEKELKESLQTRAILLSRQALRTEIDYHNNKIKELQSGNKKEVKPIKEEKSGNSKEKESKQEISEEQNNINNKMAVAKKLAEERKYTDAIEMYSKLPDEFNVDMNTLAEIRVALARLYNSIEEYSKAQNYYELVEKYYQKNEEFINLNYLDYELASLYFKMYKNERAVETIKKVIYSVDTPQSLMVDACIQLGNIYIEIENLEEAYKYYIKAIESTDENTAIEKKAELYFKLALVCDEKEDSKKAFEYYNKCIQITDNNPYVAPAYSNLGACYYENDNFSDAESCFLSAYKIEKEKNNYEGIYYVSSYLAKIYVALNSDKAALYLIEAKQSAEFLNEDFYILEATISLGDYYYSNKEMTQKALIEYFKALKVAKNYSGTVDIEKIEKRIKDMKLRMDEDEFEAVKQKYDK